MDPCSVQTIPPEGTVDKGIPFVEEGIPAKEEVQDFSNLRFEMYIHINWQS